MAESYQVPYSTGEFMVRGLIEWDGTQWKAFEHESFATGWYECAVSDRAQEALGAHFGLPGIGASALAMSPKELLHLEEKSSGQESSSSASSVFSDAIYYPG